MKAKILCSLAAALLTVVAPAMAQQAGPELVQAAVDAYNSRDVTYFENVLADDVVWMDEDGHAMSGKNIVLRFLGNQLDASPALTLSVSNVRMGSTSDAAWATFAYTITGGDHPLEGLNTTVFRRAGNDWEVVVVHGAMNAEGHH